MPFVGLVVPSGAAILSNSYDMEGRATGKRGLHRGL